MKEKDTVYYHQDPLGSTIMITDKKGHVEGRFSYDAFGSLYDDQTLPWGHDNLNERGKHSAPRNLYNGKRLDPVVGLYDYGYRDYLPQQMRFTTVDPIKPGPNWYAYVNNDPVNFIDPLGLCSETDGNKIIDIKGLALGGIEIIGGVTGIISAGSALTVTTATGVLVGDDTISPVIAVIEVSVIKASLISVGVGIATIDAAFRGESFNIPMVIQGILQ